MEAGHIVQRLLEMRLLALELNFIQARVLAAVFLSPERLTPTRLAPLVVQKAAGVSLALNWLEDRGLVVRTGDRQDHRIRWVDLTDKGKQAVVEVLRGLATELEPVLGRGREDFIRTLAEIRDSSLWSWPGAG